MTIVEMATTMTSFLNTTLYPVYRNDNKKILDIIHTAYIIIAWIIVPVNLLGLITNSLSVIIHTMNGFRDAIKICFFALSLCDLVYIIMSNCSIIVVLIGEESPSLLSHSRINLNNFAFYQSMVFEMSALIKTFIAVQRGCCVAFPFHVNRVFTKKRTVGVMVCLCLFSLASYVSKEFLDSINYVHVTVINNTYGNPSFYNEISDLSGLVRDTLKTVVVFVCEILVVLSLALILHGMSSTLKYRQSVSNTTCGSQQKLIKHNKEMRVVKQVILVSAIHLICYTPVATYSLLYQLNIRGFLPFNVLYIAVAFADVKNLAGPVNAAINFFIYYSYNSKFRYRVKNMCRREQHSATESVFVTEQSTVD